MHDLSPITAARFAALQQSLRAFGRVLVAFSGGVDSTLLLKVALETLGREAVLALTAESAFNPASERASARELALLMGARAEVIALDPLADSRVVANPPDRCYHCKQAIFSHFVDRARRDGNAVVVDGANADDVGDWRPGQRAAHELGVRSPLQEAGLTKAEVRALSRGYGLPTWDKPAYACLASRIPYGMAITPAMLAMVEAAEEELHGRGFTQVRVRHHGDLARIEAIPEELERLMEPQLRADITARLRALGYRYVALDLEGYRMGSLNAGIER